MCILQTVSGSLSCSKTGVIVLCVVATYKYVYAYLVSSDRSSVQVYKRQLIMCVVVMKPKFQLNRF